MTLLAYLLVVTVVSGITLGYIWWVADWVDAGDFGFRLPLAALGVVVIFVGLTLAGAGVMCWVDGCR